MSKQVKLRRGTATEHASFTGVVGEVTVDTTTKTIRVHDGSTVGGNQLALASGANASGTWGISVSGNAATATSVSGTIGIANGGTGGTTQSQARTNLGAAASGANTDITALDQDITITATGTIAANTIGYRGAPQSTNTTLALSDAGKHIYTASNVTIPPNSGTGNVPFPIGTTIVIANSGSGTLQIAITTDTLRQSGTANVGTRTLSQYGMATIVKVAATVWYISGTVS